MTRAVGYALIAVLVLSQVGCGTLRKLRKRDRKPAADAAAVANARRPLQPMGVVALVNEADGFALIDSGSLPTPAIGAELRSYTGTVESGQLKASAVRRRPFVVADIVGGAPLAGDKIFETAPATATTAGTAPVKP